jgi:hypothetical protein
MYIRICNICAVILSSVAVVVVVVVVSRCSLPLSTAKRLAARLDES